MDTTSYEAPKLTVVGSVESLTSSTFSGRYYDKNVQNATGALAGSVPVLS